MEPATTHKSCGGVAEMAIHRSCEVRAVHTSGRITVMAGRTVIDDSGMIKHRPDKARGVMADTTILAGCHMIQ